MFASIAGRYDRANQVLSVRYSGASEGDRVLDCATGTGDLAIAFRKAVGTTGSVTGTDFVPEMIALARQKSPDIEFEVADVTKLPYGNGQFDIASISFGIRNVGDPARGIAELARVVRSGGRVVILEFGQPRSRAFGAFYDFYRKRFLPRLGGAITGERDAYEYLESSTARFPCGQEFATLMGDSAAFSRMDWKPLTFGIAYVYRGVKG